MRRITTIIPAALLAIGLAGCNSFLDSDKAASDPNSPSTASRNQLFVGTQASIFGQQEGAIAMIVCQWMQQCAGVNGRFVDTQSNYTINAGTFDFQFSDVYRGGGLRSIRTVQEGAEAAGDKFYKGIAEVIEAMDIAFAADVWGDIPYREAGGDNSTPAFDAQQQVYDDLQKLLDQAITDINGAGAGPGAFDLVYGNLAAAAQKQAWIQAAHTLKARLYLHTVEKLGGATVYPKVLAEANLGINTAANDWKTTHSTATSERNLWAQFQISSFGNDLVAGSALVNLMKADNDPRLPEYFGKNALGGYGGWDVTTKTTPVNEISQLAGSARTNDVTFRQPVMTYEENQLIIAEAQLQLGNAPAALTALTAIRALHGKGAVPATMANIMAEKYILLYQNVEVWNDYKRTCLPILHPAKDKTVIPGRVYYGETEEQTNSNTPASEDQTLSTVRNWNDPTACPP
jgi:starch-binding outer membrane protein, SusD/RagB family